MVKRSLANSTLFLLLLLPITTSSLLLRQLPNLIPSPDGTCGPQTNNTCLTTTYGPCCSSKGFCGSTPPYCSPGCQPLYGTCDTPTTETTQTNPLAVSTSGSCSNTTTCQGSSFGNCCSRLGFCGSGPSFCGAGCQVGRGACFAPDEGTGYVVSSDGSCGARTDLGGKGVTCLGSEFGNCCSGSGFCGNNATYCGETCNSDFGSCPVVGDGSRGSDSISDNRNSGSTKNRSSGLSKGAIAGIAVAVTVVLLGAIFLVACFWRKRRAEKLTSLPVVDRPKTPEVVYVPAHELSGESSATELPVRKQFSELDAVNWNLGRGK